MQTLLLKLGIFLLRKIRFRKWTELEDRKRACLQAVEDADPNFTQLLVEHLSTASCLKVNFEKVPWKHAAVAFYKIHDVYPKIKKIPLTSRISTEKDSPKRDAWDYDGRLWYFYCNLLATAYGWSEKEIANLSVNSGLAYLQEVLTAQHQEREFLRSMSETAYKYDKVKKTSNFVPSPTPYWMQADVKAKHARDPVPIPKSLLPVGVVIMPPKR